MSQAIRAWMQEMRARERQDARDDPEIPEHIARCRQRKVDQLARARDAGLLSDDTIDGFPSLAVLGEYVGRRG